MQADLARYHIVPLGIEHDAAWRLFESLQLTATPALVTVSYDGRILGTCRASATPSAPS